MFQHRHYVAIAAIIADVKEADREAIAVHFANGLRGSNPAFDRSRFIAAAMGTPSNGRDKAK